MLRDLRRRLAFRLLAPIVVFAVGFGALLVGFVSVAVNRVAEAQIEGDLRWRAQAIFTIVDANLDELLRAGRVGDEIAVRQRKVNAMMAIEDFARANDLRIVVHDVAQQRRTEMGNKLAERTGAVQHHVHEVKFEPWGWKITLAQDNRAYLSLLATFRRGAEIGAVLFVSAVAAFMLYLTRTTRRPIEAIVADLERNRAPHYAGIAEFEYLSRSIANMMQAIQEHAQLHKATLEHIADGLCVFDGDFRVLTCNDRFFDLYGVPADDRGDPAAVSALLRGIVGSLPGEHESRRQQRSLPDGRIIDLHVSAMSGLRYLSTHADVTEHTRAETERQARIAAEAANEAKSAFLASMSHELRTPLNGILGFAQLLAASTNLDDRQRSGLNIIRSSGDHLLSLIDDILDLARVEAGKIDLDPSEVDLHKLIEEVAVIPALRAREKGVAFHVDVSPSTPLTVRADARRLRQILFNLLGNAVKFTDQGEVRLRVLPLSREAARGSVTALIRFEVQDSGIGVSRENLSLLFKPFQQVRERQRHRGGTGLGLTISRQLARMMGSDIHVTSEAGRGSRFWIDLKLPVVAAAAANGSPVSQCLPTGYEGRRRKVLIVDDVYENRAVLAEALRPLGFALYEAGDGAQGVELADALQPDIVLMDNVMPVMDGLEATRRLRESTVVGNVPIIAISASASGPDMQRAIDAGATAFLPKPFRLPALLALIEEHVGVRYVYATKAQDLQSQPAVG